MGGDLDQGSMWGGRRLRQAPGVRTAAWFKDFGKGERGGSKEGKVTCISLSRCVTQAGASSYFTPVLDLITL